MEIRKQSLHQPKEECGANGVGHNEGRTGGWGGGRERKRRKQRRAHARKEETKNWFRYCAHAVPPLHSACERWKQWGVSFLGWEDAG